MTVKEIFENKVESSNLNLSENIINALDDFETGLSLIADKGLSKSLFNRLALVIYGVEQETYIQGFKDGVQLMANCTAVQSYE